VAQVRDTVEEIMGEVGSLVGFLRSHWSRAADERGVGFGGIAVLHQVSKRPGITATQIAQGHDLDKAVVSRKVTQLRELDYIQSEPSPEDGRVMLLTPTATGQQVLEDMRREMYGAYWNRLESWGQTELDEFLRVLRRFNSETEDAVNNMCNRS
jgi:DNA-binding MarR family transcriptional regulator